MKNCIICIPYETTPKECVILGCPEGIPYEAAPKEYP